MKKEKKSVLKEKLTLKLKNKKENVN